MSRHIVILGAGISGLACAWALRKKYGSSILISIVEKSDRVGGWIHSIQKDGFLFETGPRSCRSKGAGAATLQLIEELGLAANILFADPNARYRYLYKEEALQRLPHNLFSFLTSPILKEVVSALWHDLWTPKQSLSDESIYSFISRRLSPSIASNLMDPLVSGIYAGDIKQLSVRSCFPQLYAYEQQSGSIVKGLFKRKRKNSENKSSFVEQSQKHSIFTLQGGMQTLPEELRKQVDATIHFNSTVRALNMHSDGVIVCLDKDKILKADHVFSALPASALQTLLPPNEASLKEEVINMYASVAVVNLGYQADVWENPGFGYLIPSKEQKKVLGCVWDSSVFPQQNQQAKETRLTLMLGGIHHPEVSQWSEKECLETALEAVSKQMKIDMQPAAFNVSMANQAIPQYRVGYHSHLLKFLGNIKKYTTRLSVIGSSFGGVSVNDCIQNAIQKVNESHLS